MPRMNNVTITTTAGEQWYGRDLEGMNVED